MIRNWKEFQAALMNARPWIILFAVPLAVNLLLWNIFVLPEQGRLGGWAELERLDGFKPKLESRLMESQTLLASEKHSGFKAGGSTTEVLDEIERLAKENHVAIQTSRVEGEKSNMPSIELNVLGNFDKLARWTSEVEATPGLQVNSWSLISSKEPNSPHKLSINLLVLFKEGA